MPLHKLGLLPSCGSFTALIGNFYCRYRFFSPHGDANDDRGVADMAGERASPSANVRLRLASRDQSTLNRIRERYSAVALSSHW